MTHTIHISVRELVERFVRAGDLQTGVFVADRVATAVSLHQKIQQSRPSDYEPEVAVSHTCRSGPWTIHLAGRIDGLWRINDHLVIEEIKTTTGRTEDAASADIYHHWAQLKIYAYMVSVKNQLETVDTCLTYARIYSSSTQEVRRQFARAELEAFFDSLIARLVHRLEDIRHFQDLRDRSIATLRFPFQERRSGQQRMMEEVYQSVAKEIRLFVQAPTGIGKTMAVILPALKALAQRKIERIFYLTARSTGKQVAEESFDILREQTLRLKTLTLTAKEKICFKLDAACHPDECEYAKGYYDRIDEAVDSAFELDRLDRDAIEETAARHKVCPFEFSLEMSEMADCIICDYNYVFDPQAGLKRFFVRPREAYLFLVDEAHNLVDRSREMYSSGIWKQSFLRLRRQVKEALPDVYQTLGKVNTQLLKLKKATADSEDGPIEVELPESLGLALNDFVKTAGKWLAFNRQTSFREKLLDLYFEATRFMKVFEMFDTAYTVCCEKIAKDFRVKLFCIDPSAPLSRVLDKGRATVFFSATLTPMEYFQQTFGCAQDSNALVLASPFPRENMCVLVSALSTLFRNRKRTKTGVAKLIQSLVSQKRGNYLVFFPSYSYMSMVVREFEGNYPQIETLVQTPRLTEIDRMRFLQKFSRNNPSTLVGFAVMGGVFGEGIDLVGDRLTGAIVVGVGLPPPSMEREHINAYYAEHYDTGFEFAYIFPGFNKVLQASGRVIRSETDRGVILLIDSRFASPHYQAMFPIEWQPMPVHGPDDIARTLEVFWQD